MPHIQTFTGKNFSPLSPRHEDIDIRDIAHALSLKCRFGGHCRNFYSVADHSLRVSQIAPPYLALAALMHDAAEAYLPDINRPIKPHLLVQLTPTTPTQTFDDIETHLLLIIAQALNFPPIDYSTIAQPDLILLATEARDLMSPSPKLWNLGVNPLPEKIQPLTPTQAEQEFLTRFTTLITLEPRA